MQKRENAKAFKFKEALHKKEEKRKSLWEKGNATLILPREKKFYFKREDFQKSAQ